MLSRRIDVKDQAVTVLISLKTQQLSKALDEQAKALEELVKSLKDFNDWLEEELVRLDGEK